MGLNLAGGLLVDECRKTLLGALRGDAWFGDLPVHVQNALLTRARIVEKEPNAVIFSAGDDPTGIYGIVRGTVRMEHVTGQGERSLSYFIPSPRWFGTISTFDSGPRIQNASACDDVVLCHVSHIGLRRLLSEMPEVWGHLAPLLAMQVRRIFDRLETMATKPIEVRIARALLSLTSESFTLEEGHNASPPMTQDDLAAAVGATRQSVSKVLKTWERDGMIAVRYRSVEICDPIELSAIARS